MNRDDAIRAAQAAMQSDAQPIFRASFAHVAPTRTTPPTPANDVAARVLPKAI